MAAHARRCPGCAAFADDVARVRAWLAGMDHAARAAAGPAPSATQSATPNAGQSAGQCAGPGSCARAALVRELAARIARDLLACAGVAPPRSAGKARADRARLVALLGRRGVREPPWPAALRLLSPHAVAESGAGERREHLLAAAARLDPLGLDVALGHIAQLERDGRRAQADAHADGVIARLV
jgi:hypothetical protein